ncbi:probable cystathionine gamma-synthase 2 isoform X1 [Panicum virgatum]|uniref:probable cystathionine gamma-synthase 2 isoform X1 n=1 Tax=Panicum virgatum TaxID=38727 RepID=UPI0019D57A3B|nr:probable cystathionine gamma-synthase 2 isoform X1 [Panicum virgatum]
MRTHYLPNHHSTTNKPHRISKGLTSDSQSPPTRSRRDRSSRAPRPHAAPRRAATETLAPPPPPQPWPPSRSRRRWSSPPSRAAPSPPPQSSVSRQTSCASSAPRPAATAATSASRRSSPRRGRTAPPAAPTPAAAAVSAIPNANVAQPSAVVQAERNLLGSDASLAVHAGERLGRRIATDAITTPVVNTSAYWFNNSQELIDFKEGRHASFEYGRYGNPTTEALEKKMSALEKAESTVFVASGMYAAVAMLSALVPAGGHIVTTTDCYRKTRIYMENELPKRGVSMTVIRPADMDALQNALDNNNVSLFFTETPTNPFLRCIDVELVANMCHSKGALLCIDSTFASPINQKALTLGADLVIHSATKYIAGHNDVIGGCVSGRDELVSKVRIYHHVVGGVLNPNAAYLILRGMKTLHLRVQCQNNTALRMAQFLEEHPKIARVYYPGLPSHPEHHIAKTQMTGFGGVVSFEVAGDFDGTRRFIDSVKIPYHAPSFGGCESIIDQPAIMSYWDSKEQRDIYGIKDNLIRFSIGVEDFEDLKNDLVQALEKV